mmetsp:Transcript_6410/g.18155  ORF Transcript_6410/g.18155 Transcript_6410/m.18155 type:complete len:589 (+) Transcript_6410:225-1991(+)
MAEAKELRPFQPHADGMVVALLDVATVVGEEKGLLANFRRRKNSNAGVDGLRVTASLDAGSVQLNGSWHFKDFKGIREVRGQPRVPSIPAGSSPFAILRDNPRVRLFLESAKDCKQIGVKLEVEDGQVLQDSFDLTADHLDGAPFIVSVKDTREGNGIVRFDTLWSVFSSSTGWEDAAVRALEGHVALHLHKVDNIPKLDLLSASDAYCVAYLYPEALTRKQLKKLLSDGNFRPANAKRWETIDDAVKATWNSVRDLGHTLNKNNFVILEVWDEDPESSDDLVGVVSVPVKDIPHFSDKGGNVSFPLDCKKEGTVATFSRIPLGVGTPFPTRKTLFYVRHGVSEWNKAQAGRDLGGMFGQVDHPLDEAGVKQALNLARQIEEAQKKGSSELTLMSLLMAPDTVYASPLTRALETCVIGMAPVLRNMKTLKLLRSAREKKNAGGRDTLGKDIGQDIITKLRKAIEMSLDKESAEKYINNIDFDLSEVMRQWWSVGMEQVDPFEARLSEFMSRLKYSPHRTITVVGHSHFFRSLCQTYLHPNAANTKLGKDLRVHVISNCGVVAVDLDFLQHPSEVIYDMQLMFDTTIVS